MPPMLLGLPQGLFRTKSLLAFLGLLCKVNSGVDGFHQIGHHQFQALLLVVSQVLQAKHLLHTWAYIDS